jgi:uncharacterized membrane protein
MPASSPPTGAPQFLDYRYVSLTNALAFSPTDTMPLTRTAKVLMAIQSFVSLVTIGLVVSRAVNPAIAGAASSPAATEAAGPLTGQPGSVQREPTRR